MALRVIVFLVLLLITVGTQQAFASTTIDPESLPEWVKNFVLVWYEEGKVTGNEIYYAINFLINEGIII